MSPQRVLEEEPSVSDYRRSVADYDAGGDNEISLGTPTILGMFFALAVVCACFFGLGYALGHRSAPAQMFDATPAVATSTVKPAAGSSEAAPTPDNAVSSTTVQDSASSSQTVPLKATPVAAPIAAHTAGSVSAVPVAPAVAPGTFVVQVAAVSSQDVANILVSSLQKKDYSVAVREEPQDKLMHVQIGPFTNRKDAEAMRQRVLGDGFNAIVK